MSKVLNMLVVTYIVAIVIAMESSMDGSDVYQMTTVVNFTTDAYIF